MNRKAIPIDKLEQMLSGLFDLSDGENSEDGYESDENDNEAVFQEPSTSELEEILEPSLPALSETRPEDTTSITQPIASSSGLSSNRPLLAAPTSETELSDSESSDDDDEQWKKGSFPHNPPSDKFDEVVLQPSQFFPNRSAPGAYFGALFSDDVFAHIVDQTNIYATQNKQKDWDSLTLPELKAFFGILIFMGIHILPNVNLYWSSDPFFRVLEIAEVMPVKRFKKILSNLHVNDNSKMPKRDELGYDKLYKIRPLITFMNDAFQNSAVCSTSQSIDECMIKFKGRSAIKQYMPMKPVKRGFKVWARCDSKTGYLYQFEVYTGKKNNVPEVGLGASVVKELTQQLINQNRENTHVAFDNFFASFELLQYLFEKNIYSTATVRQDRTNLPNMIKNSRKRKNTPNHSALKLNKGQYKWRINKNVAFFVWMDTKLVNVLSSAYHPSQKTSCKRTQKDGSKSDVACPIGIIEYTKRMGGVDRFDQKRGTYAISRRSRRWWMRIFYFLVDAAITNAYILYSQNARVHNPMMTLQFRTLLARNLINNYSSRKRPASILPNFVTKKSKSSSSRQKELHGIPDSLRLSDVGLHMPKELPTYRRCRACSTKSASKKTKIECTKCTVPLCTIPCFAEFHKA